MFQLVFVRLGSRPEMGGRCSVKRPLRYLRGPGRVPVGSRAMPQVTALALPCPPMCCPWPADHQLPGLPCPHPAPAVSAQAAKPRFCSLLRLVKRRAQFKLFLSIFVGAPILIARVASWIRRRPPKEEIVGSSPISGICLQHVGLAKATTMKTVRGSKSGQQGSKAGAVSQGSWGQARPGQ